MQPIACDVAIIGGGPAGLAAAVGAKAAGAKRVILLERDARLGGILNQCIHAGFGLHAFSAELTGPEYAARYIDMARDAGAEALVSTMVLSIDEGADGRLCVHAVSRAQGLLHIDAGAVVLAMGCRERPRGAINIPGTRPSGVYTAGTAQYLVNIEGKMVGKRALILGSGDIGLIMARRLAYEGAEVLAVCEVMPYSSGLGRNVVQCLEDLSIPLLLSHTAIEVHGRERVEGVTVARVDGNRRPIPGTERFFACDTLLLSVGLIPENELSVNAGVDLCPATGGPVVDDSLMTKRPGIFACGNVLHVHDLVDHVSEQAHSAGENAARFAKSGAWAKASMRTILGDNVHHVVPMYIHGGETTLRFRVARPVRNARITLTQGDRVLRTIRKRIATPGEMETIRIDIPLGGDVRVDVRGETR